MRKLVIGVSLAATVAAALPLAVLASHSNRTAGQLDRQESAWRTRSVSTSSTEWRTLRRPSFNVCAENGLTLTLSATLTGAPVRFRVVMDGGPVLDPGPAAFVPAADARTFSATFAGHAGTFEGLDRHVLELQWRSPTGRPVTLVRGLAAVLYEQGASC